MDALLLLAVAAPGQRDPLLAALERVEVDHVLVQQAQRGVSIVGGAVSGHHRLGRLDQRREPRERGAVVGQRARLRDPGDLDVARGSPRGPARHTSARRRPCRRRCVLRPDGARAPGHPARPAPARAEPAAARGPAASGAPRRARRPCRAVRAAPPRAPCMRCTLDSARPSARPGKATRPSRWSKSAWVAIRARRARSRPPRGPRRAPRAPRGNRESRSASLRRPPAGRARWSARRGS